MGEKVGWCGVQVESVVEFCCGVGLDTVGIDIGDSYVVVDARQKVAVTLYEVSRGSLA